jgi:hypothetical protein
MKKTRVIETEEYTGHVEKAGSQFGNRWARYILYVTDKRTGLEFYTSISKLHKMWINDHDPIYSRKLDDMVFHVLTSIAPMYTKES